MQQVIKQYKVVRRGPKYCVRVSGTLNTTEALDWCRKRNINYHIKLPWNISRNSWHREGPGWDYDFTFDRPAEATAFILGYL